MSDVSLPLWVPAYIGIGSNLDDPLARVRSAFASLSRLDGTRLIRASGIYRTAPMGPVEQPDFYNAAAGLLTQLQPLVLLRSLKELELQLGREASTRRWGPRQIDFDVLVYGDVVMQEQALTLPHPGLVQRAFALVPLADIAPEMRVPGAGRVADLVAKCDRSGLEWASDGPIT